MASGDLHAVERIFGNAVKTICGCLRGLFCAPKGGEFLCSDFSAIEGVVAAALAGEEWRLEVFRTHGMIYEMSASLITGVPFEEFIRHKKETGKHHPLRKKIGKIAELASQFQGGYRAWKAFGAEKLFDSDDDIKASVKAWRKASPNIVAMWKGLDQAAKNAVRSPGTAYEYNGIKYFVWDGVLYCELLSGRRLAYQKPRLRMDQWDDGGDKEVLVFEGWNSDSTKGPVGWHTFDTFGGRLFENCVQATARDIMCHAMLNLDAAGYPIVLHVHDEPVAEVATGTGSIEHFEWLMMQMPQWCKDWPIKAAGGWRGKRYRKD
jgi:DNA polymerase